MTVYEYLKGLGPALPLSPMRNSDNSFKPMSNADIRRLCEQKSILINGEHVSHSEPMDFPVFSLVIYPKSPNKRTTLV